MNRRLLRIRRSLMQKEVAKELPKESITPSSKIVLCWLGDKLVGEYDSITKCGLALGLSRPVVRKAIEYGTLLDNGFTLTFK